MDILYQKIRQLFIPIAIPFSFWTTIALISGIAVAHLRWHWSSLIPLLLFAPLLHLCYETERFTKIATWSFFFFCTGMATYSYHAQRSTSFFTIKRVRLYAQVADIRRLEGRTFCYKTILNVEKFKYQDVWFKNSFRLAIYTTEEPTCSIGSYISCGTFDITPPSNEGFALYLKKEGLAGALFLKQLYFTHLKIPAFSGNKWLHRCRNTLWQRLQRKIPPLPFAFFSSLFLGNRSVVDQELDPYKTPFKTWGITHCLSRSGMHLIIFVLVWNTILNFLPISFTAKNLLLSLLLLLYCLLSWTSIPFMRAVHIYFLYKLASLLGFQHHSLNILCIVCSTTLLYKPFYLFALDFQLTFLLSFSLIWIAHVLHQRKIFTFQNVALPF